MCPVTWELVRMCEPVGCACVRVCVCARTHCVTFWVSVCVKCESVCACAHVYSLCVLTMRTRVLTQRGASRLRNTP